MDLFAREMAGNERDRKALEEDQSQHAVDQNRRWKMVCARRQAREREDDEVHHNVDNAAVDEAAEDWTAREKRDARGCEQKQSCPEERDGVVDGETERRECEPVVEGGDSDKAGGDELQETLRRNAAKAVEDEGVGDVECAGDEQAEAESFGEAARCDASHAGDCRWSHACPRTF